MAETAEGTWKCKVLDGNAGPNEKNIMTVRINAQITEGPSAGRRVTYENVVDNRSAKYVVMSAKAVGWTGQTLATFRDDIAAWIARTGGESTVEIRHLKIERGKRYDKWCDGGCVGPQPIWDKVHAIGVGPKPLKEPTTRDLADADEALARAMAEADSGGGGSAGPDDSIPPPSDDDIPFITSSDVKVRAW